MAEHNTALQMNAFIRIRFSFGIYFDFWPSGAIHSSQPAELYHAEHRKLLFRLYRMDRGIA